MASILKRLLHPDTTPSASEIHPGPFTIQVRGDDSFVATARGALDLIERSCPDYYQVVVGHVAVIECADDGATRHHEEPPRIALESSIGYGRDLPPRSKLLWYASAIVHEAWHSKLFREHRLANPDAPWPVDERSVLEREDNCLEVQLDALLRMGAPQWMLDYVRSRIGLGDMRTLERAW